MDVLHHPVPHRHCAIGAILLLAALGLTLTFGQMGVINMANGEFLMAGAYTAYVTQQVITSAGISILVALAGGLRRRRPPRVCCSRSTLIQWMYKRPLDTLLVTVGVSLVLQQLAPRTSSAPRATRCSRAELAVRAASRSSATTGRYRQLFTIVLARRSASPALSAVLKYSSFGRRIRATVQNRELAETMRRLDPQRRPHHVLPRLRPGRRRRRRRSP